MSVSNYLKQKYGMNDDAKLPTEWLGEELHLSLSEVKPLVRQALQRKSCPEWITFAAFVLICVEVLNR